MITLFRTYKITGWRRKAPIFGKPDFVFRHQRIAVFVDGCFWHRHLGCRFAYTPKSRVEFWLEKFKRNVERDRLVNLKLRKLGWSVIRVWECDLVSAKSWPVIARRLLRKIGTET